VSGLLPTTNTNPPEACPSEKYAMLYQDGIPYATRNEAVSRIQGEVYSVDDDTLKDLDSLEQHPEWYCRGQDEVVLGGGSSTVKAWLYFNPTPEGTLVETGIFFMIR